jgi:uncharacterized membrane protein YvbJ
MAEVGNTIKRTIATSGERLDEARKEIAKEAQKLAGRSAKNISRTDIISWIIIFILGIGIGVFACMQFTQNFVDHYFNRAVQEEVEKINLEK